MKYASPDPLLSTKNLSLHPVYVGKRFLVTVAMYVLKESQSTKSCQSSYWLTQSIHGGKSALAVYTFSYKKTKPFLRSFNVTSWSFLAAVDR
jgi:hypothetical protein